LLSQQFFFCSCSSQNLILTTHNVFFSRALVQDRHERFCCWFHSFSSVFLSNLNSQGSTTTLFQRCFGDVLEHLCWQQKTDYKSLLSKYYFSGPIYHSQCHFKVNVYVCVGICWRYLNDRLVFGVEIDLTRYCPRRNFVKDSIGSSDINTIIMYHLESFLGHRRSKMWHTGYQHAVHTSISIFVELNEWKGTH
jgi:hypothetical protein